MTENRQAGGGGWEPEVDWKSLIRTELESHSPRRLPPVFTPPDQPPGFLRRTWRPLSLALAAFLVGAGLVTASAHPGGLKGAFDQLRGIAHQPSPGELRSPAPTPSRTSTSPRPSTSPSLGSGPPQGSQAPATPGAGGSTPAPRPTGGGGPPPTAPVPLPTVSLPPLPTVSLPVPTISLPIPHISPIAGSGR
jgi:hypothetical protein